MASSSSSSSSGGAASRVYGPKTALNLAIEKWLKADLPVSMFLFPAYRPGKGEQSPALTLAVQQAYAPPGDTIDRTANGVPKDAALRAALGIGRSFLCTDAGINALLTTAKEVCTAWPKGHPAKSSDKAHWSTKRPLPWEYQVRRTLSGYPSGEPHEDFARLLRAYLKPVVITTRKRRSSESSKRKRSSSPAAAADSKSKKARVAAPSDGMRSTTDEVGKMMAVEQELEAIIEKAYVTKGRFASEGAFRNEVSTALTFAGFKNGTEVPYQQSGAKLRFDIFVTGTHGNYPSSGQYSAAMGPIILEFKTGMGSSMTPKSFDKAISQVLGYANTADQYSSVPVAAGAVVYAPKHRSDGAGGMLPASKGEVIVKWVYAGDKYKRA